MIAEFLGFIAIVIILAYFYWTKNYKYWEERSVPSLPAEFPWGSLKGVDPFKQNIGHFLQSLYDLHENVPVVGFYGPTEPFLLIKDLDMVKSALVTDFKSFHQNGYHTYGSIDPVIRYNAFGTQSMEEWKNLRGILSPLFTQNKVKTNVPQLTQITKSMVQYIRDHCDEHINAKTISRNFAVDSVLNVGYGLDSDSFKSDTKDPLSKPGVFFGSEWSSNAAAWCSMFLPWLALLLRCSTIGKEAKSIIAQWGDSLILKRRKENNSRVDVIQRMMFKMEKDKQQNNPEMSEDVKVAQYMTFMVDGYETAASALTFALYNIATHPDIQEKLRKEILVVGNSIDDFDGDKILSLKYLDDCMFESLRLRPSIPILTRRCTEKTFLGSLSIPVGIKVFIPIQAIQTDPNHFPDPLSYNPDRFAHEDASKHPALFAFGEGPRICLGMRHGQLYLKMALIALLLKFKMYPVGDLTFENSFFFYIPNDVMLKFEPL